MSQRAPMTIDNPDEGQVKLDVSIAGGGNGAAVAGEEIPGRGRDGDATWLLAAVSGEGGERTAIDVIDVLRASASDASTADLGAALKQGYRRLNSTFYQNGMGRQTASAVAMIATGKYATISQVGDGRAYLLRADRLNQITRDAAPAPLKPGKAKEESNATESVRPLLGARERLDSRQPAIYEITLLPGDRVLLCTASVYQEIGDTALSQELTQNGTETAPAMLALVNGPAAVAVAVVSAARERAPIVVAREGQTSPLPLIAAAVVILVLIAAYAIYAFLL